MTRISLTDDRIDPDHRIFEGIDTEEKPVFLVSEMAKFFFARTNHWIRWLEAGGKMMHEVDGEMVPMGTRRDKNAGRIYTLSDIEEIAHGLAANGTISGTQLRNTLRILRAQGEMYGYI